MLDTWMKEVMKYSSGSPELILVANKVLQGWMPERRVGERGFRVDVTNTGTLEMLDTWMKEVMKYSSGSPELILVANKVLQGWMPGEEG